MTSLVKGKPGLSSALAESLRQLIGQVDGRVEAGAAGSVNAQAAAIWEVGQSTAVNRIQKLDELELVEIIRDGRTTKMLTVVEGALAQVEAFERDHAKEKASRQNSDLTARLRKACEVGRPRAVLKLHTR